MPHTIYDENDFPDSVKDIIKDIEKSRIEAFKKALPTGKTYEDAKREVMQELQVFFNWLNFCLDLIFKSQSAIEAQITQIKSRHQQNIIENLLSKEVLILRCAFLYAMFFKLQPAKNSQDFSVNTQLFRRSLENTLKRNGRPYDAKLIINEVYQYTTEDNFQSEVFSERVGERVPLIVFESTEGRMAGELYDAITELIQNTIEEDKKSFIQE